MTGAIILAFPGARLPVFAPSLSRRWIDRHGPLLDAALALGQAEEPEFARRCRAIVEGEGALVLDHLMIRVERLAEQTRRIATALAMVAARIRCLR